MVSSNCKKGYSETETVQVSPIGEKKRIKNALLFLKMQKNLFSIYRPLSYVSAAGSKSIHVNYRNITNSSEDLADRLSSILYACSDASVLRQGRQVHAQIIVNGLSHVGFVGTRILGMYVHCKNLIDSKNLFFQLDLQCPSPWNWMIRGFTAMGWFQFALLFYFKMLGCGTSPDNYTFPCIIKACGVLSALNLGRLIHGTISLMGFEGDVFVGSSLIKFYSENDCIEDARCLFDKMPHKDCVLWNVMLNGYLRNGNSDKVLGLFNAMRKSEIEPNSVTFACVVSISASEELIDYGRQLHGLSIAFGLDLDSPVANSLLTMYAKCSCLSDAYRLFKMMPQNDLVTWNAMISGYVQNGFMDDAWYLFGKMLSSGVKPDSVTFSSFLPSISGSAGVKHGKKIHGYIVRHGVCVDEFLASALIDIYFKCREVEMACRIFKRIATVDIVIYTAMISGYVLNGMNSHALEIFQRLIEEKMRPNSVTMASVLPAFAGMAALKLGKELHGYIFKNGHNGRCYVDSALVDMYAKCGRLDLARWTFRGMQEKDAVAWNSMITSCCQHGNPEEAIGLFCEMGMAGTKYDHVTISAALSACANIPALHYGKAIHGFMMKDASRSDLFAKSALIDMYGKCGNLVFAHRVFDLMEVKNEVSWNSIIAAYGTHGLVKDSVDLFHKMLEEGFQPDHITFLAVISASGHAGKVDEGFHYFRSMTENYGIMARMEHYACIVDMFGRAGHLNEALGLIRSMPFDPDSGIWGALLGACRVHGNVEFAELASKHLFELEPENSGYYMLLSNVHADAGQWESVLKIRSLMKERRVQKLPGYSWIEVNSVTRMFVAADTTHPESDQIYQLLKCLILELRKEGYVAQPYLPIHPTNISENYGVRLSSP